ncbi:uncharacterized protein LOC105390547 isoform X3 [Plutella xylostella]|uniref:uncharacterized protein LOC105390547 isoform X3 n=1 Tax=Plutella xylostella TaxID=51655 RepID=UPI00203222EA|nr:uncharacterized protein LOC105390547 isoform X3 [Plutella xylostella]
MGQAGSQPAAAPPRRAHTLPHEPPRHAPKVLPSLTESPRLRSTNNGQILQSGGTISGRRPSQPEHRAPHGHTHMNAFRSRSAGAAGAEGAPRDRERDPLHRSHTNLDLRQHEGSLSKRFGSEPDLRIEEEQQKPRNNNNKHFRKKYRAPPPPQIDNRDGSSPDSSEGNTRAEPQRKLRLFKTRNETKKQNVPVKESKIPQYRSTEYKSLDLNNQAFERRYKSPFKDKDQHFKYPDTHDMKQSTSSLKREEHILQGSKQDYRKSRTDRTGGCRAKTNKTNETEAWKTPLLNRDFRYSERFKREEEISPLRREKSFDATLISSDRDSESPKALHESRMKTIGEQLKVNKLSPLASTSKPLRKSLPSLLVKNIEEKDEFQTELKKATSRIRSDLVSKVNNISENKTSQKEKSNAQRPNPTKNSASVVNKVKDSSPKISIKKPLKEEISVSKLSSNRRPLTRLNDNKPTITASSNVKTTNVTVHVNSKRNPRAMPDRGQASGKESTPEHSPTRKKEPVMNHFSKEKAPPQERKQSAPSKQFYFGMIEQKQSAQKDNLKDFPGLGSPIIEEISNFHLIEKKLLGYHDEDEEFEKFNARLKEDCKIKNISSESALSSDGSEGEGSDSSLGIALRLRPTLPKKQPAVPRFSPAAAWRQLASLDAHLAAETQPLAVETKVLGEASPESSPRSEQSADKSGDSGISGDHAHSDPRLDSPSRHHPEIHPDTWTPQQDLGDSSSDGAGQDLVRMHPDGLVTYSARGQPFSLSLPREPDKFKGMSCFYECFQGKQIQQGFNSLQKLRKSVSGALGAALGSRRFDLEHEPMLPEQEQNWFLTKSAPNSLSNPLLFPTARKVSAEEDIKEETPPPEEKEESGSWRPGGASYMSWGGHVMYLPPAPAAARQPLSMLGPIDRPVRSKSSGELEVAARAARAARGGALAGEMRERERSASPGVARALPATVHPVTRKSTESRSRGKRFTFQSTVRQLERRRLAERLSREADLKEQQRKTELEAMRRVEEEFQRKRAREKASIRQQLRLVSGSASMPSNNHHAKLRDEPDGSAFRESPAPESRSRDSRDGRARHSNASSETSGRSKSTTPVRCIELSEWRVAGDSAARQYRDWGARPAPAHAHPPACARMPIATPAVYNATEVEAFTGSPRSDNYRLEFARGVARSPRTPRAPRLLAAREPSSSGSELSLRHPIQIREETKEEPEEPAIVPTLRPAGPARAAVATH